MDSQPPSSSTPTPNLPRGLIGRRGTPAGRGTRLPSIRAPRDLTLGGIPKKTFTPNIPARREKKEESVKEGEDHKRSQNSRGNTHGRGRKERERGRGRGRGRPETIQSHSIFESGPAQKVNARVSTADVGSGVGGLRAGGGRGVSAAAIVRGIKKEGSEDSDILGALLKDDFVDYDDGTVEKSFFPVKLPLSSSCATTSVKPEEKPAIEEKGPSIKKEPIEHEDMETEDKKVEGISMVSAMKPQMVSPSEFFTCKEKSELGEMVFVQLPDALPGTPTPTTKEKDNEKTLGADKDQASSDKISDKSNLSLSNFSEGYIGKIQIYKSGLTKLVLGDISLDVGMGAPCSFLQDVMSVRVKEDGEKPTGEMCVLGHVRNRIICTPDFETLLNLSSDSGR